MILASIGCFPVKSLGGYAPATASVDARGIVGDRRWMVIDARGRFLTRRQVPAMARLTASPSAHGLTIAGPAGECRAVTPGEDAPVTDATVWRDGLAVRLGNPAADAFLSDALGQPVRLAFQHDASRRPIAHPDARPGDHVSLADGFPLLVTTQASLGAVNGALDRPVTMARFRANLVVAGGQAWQEDRWRRLRIGNVELRLAGPCARCVVITQQPDTGERLDGNEPLSALRAVGRRMAGGTMFGQNAIPDRPGILSVGDKVEILDADD